MQHVLLWNHHCLQWPCMTAFGSINEPLCMYVDAHTVAWGSHWGQLASLCLRILANAADSRFWQPRKIAKHTVTTLISVARPITYLAIMVTVTHQTALANLERKWKVAICTVVMLRIIHGGKQDVTMCTWLEHYSNHCCTCCTGTQLTLPCSSAAIVPTAMGSLCLHNFKLAENCVAILDADAFWPADSISCLILTIS